MPLQKKSGNLLKAPHTSPASVKRGKNAHQNKYMTLKLIEI